MDERLIKLLQKDARQSSEVIAKQLNVSPATIRRRIRKLIRSGTMRITAIADPVKIGLPLAAIIAFNVEHGKLDSIMRALVDRPEVEWVSTTTGRFDMLVLARFASTEELSRFVEKEMAELKGIKDSETFICLRIESAR